MSDTRGVRAIDPVERINELERDNAALREALVGLAVVPIINMDDYDTPTLTGWRCNLCDESAEDRAAIAHLDECELALESPTERSASAQYDREAGSASTPGAATRVMHGGPADFQRTPHGSEGSASPLHPSESLQTNSLRQGADSPCGQPFASEDPLNAHQSNKAGKTAARGNASELTPIAQSAPATTTRDTLIADDLIATTCRTPLTTALLNEHFLTLSAVLTEDQVRAWTRRDEALVDLCGVLEQRCEELAAEGHRACQELSIVRRSTIRGSIIRGQIHEVRHRG